MRFYSKRAFGGAPYNPGLRVLIEGKRRAAAPQPKPDDGSSPLGWHERGYLPHCDDPTRVQFITFRLADSFPASKRAEWEVLAQIESIRERRKKLDEYLDRGFGKAYLRDPRIAALVEADIRTFSEHEYELRAWVVMGNHVHVLIKPHGVQLGRIVAGWKKHTGRLANRLLNRRGSFWAADYFDLYMRNLEHERKTVRYIEGNPVRAKLVLEPTAWPWSSARLRDNFGRLKL